MNFFTQITEDSVAGSKTTLQELIDSPDLFAIFASKTGCTKETYLKVLTEVSEKYPDLIPQITPEKRIDFITSLTEYFMKGTIAKLIDPLLGCLGHELQDLPKRSEVSFRQFAR